MKPFVVSAPPRKSYLFGRRTHHGFYGCACLAASAFVPNETARSLLVGIGAGLITHDWADRNAWLVDFLKHPATQHPELN